MSCCKNLNIQDDGKYNKQNLWLTTSFYVVNFVFTALKNYNMTHVKFIISVVYFLQFRNHFERRMCRDKGRGRIWAFRRRSWQHSVSRKWRKITTLHTDHPDLLRHRKSDTGNHWWASNFIGSCIFRLCQMAVKNIKLPRVLNLFFKTW